MPGRYKFKKEDLKSLYSIIDLELRDRYWDVYRLFGLVQPKGANWICVSSEGHSLGTDNHPSMSIDNTTGLYKCHCCQIHERARRR